ncbi:monocarboxylate transporter [Echinococcus multilocularis]|uniref:Monocarboxylate transporter n=1 Tax=Echinococcus multilocularis TaxID=6211 RepID=A0A068XX03_ECHMU|nr:monocarboxylate transporter [Echinococcus multilocularis]
MNNISDHHPSNEGPSTKQDLALNGSDVTADGGYGWIVVLASFFIYCLINGLACTYGINTTDVVEHYAISKQSVRWVKSVLLGLTFIRGLSVYLFPSPS